MEQPARPVDQLGALHDEVADAGATLVVRHGREHPERLVQRQVHDVVAQHDAAAVDVHDGGVRVDAAAHLAHDLAVDGHPARGDQLLGGAAGGHPGLGQHLLQPDAVAALSSVLHCPLPVVQARVDRIDGVDVGQQGRQRRQVVDRRQPQPLEEQLGGAEQRALRRAVHARLLDEPSGHQGTQHAVAVHTAYRRDAGAGHRLAVGDHGEGLQRRPGELGALAAEQQPFDVGGVGVAGVEPPARPPPGAGRSPGRPPRSAGPSRSSAARTRATGWSSAAASASSSVGASTTSSSASRAASSAAGSASSGASPRSGPSVVVTRRMSSA